MYGFERGENMIYLMGKIETSTSTSLKSYILGKILNYEKRRGTLINPWDENIKAVCL